MSKKIKGKIKKKIYGLEQILELFDCNLEYLTSRGKIGEFIKKLCQLIKVRRHGPLIIKRYKGGGFFGEGYSFCQFITTSSIVGHFIEKERIAFINIFSCSIFDSKKVTFFAKEFFEAKKIKNRVIIH